MAKVQPIGFHLSKMSDKDMANAKSTTNQNSEQMFSSGSNILSPINQQDQDAPFNLNETPKKTEGLTEVDNQFINSPSLQHNDLQTPPDQAVLISNQINISKIDISSSNISQIIEEEQLMYDASNAFLNNNE